MDISVANVVLIPFPAIVWAIHAATQLLQNLLACKSLYGMHCSYPISARQCQGLHQYYDEGSEKNGGTPVNLWEWSQVHLVRMLVFEILALSYFVCLVFRAWHQSFLLIAGRCYHQYNHETGDDQRRCYKGHDEDASPTCREFATNDPVLRFEITVETDEQDQDRYA